MSTSMFQSKTSLFTRNSRSSAGIGISPIIVVGGSFAILGIVSLAFGAVVFYLSDGIKSDALVASAVAGSLLLVFGIACVIEGKRANWSDY